MKRIFSMALCLVLALLMLVSCGEDEIKQLYDPPATKESVSLNLYIICDEGSDKAKSTVLQRIADYTNGKYKTTVNVKYCTPEEYSSVIASSFAGAEGVASADLFLINSKEMYDSLMASNKLADLSVYMDSEAYGTLNAQIASSLLAASATEDGKYYCVPNNRVVGEYEYLTIDKVIAREYYYSDAILTTYTSLEVLQNNLWQVLTRAGKNPVDYVTAVEEAQLPKRFITGSYYCNLIASPTEDDAVTKYSYLFTKKSLNTEKGISEDVINSWTSLELFKASTIWKDELKSSDYVEIVDVDTPYTDLDLTLAGGSYYCNNATDGNKYILISTEIDTICPEIPEYIINRCTDYAKMQEINLWDKLLAEGKNPADYIKIEKGSYQYRDALTAEGKICNVFKYPVATKEMAYSSAYAISAGYAYPERAMEILYAINTDKELHNLLQFGIHGTNYEIEGGMIVRTTEDDRGYIINPYYIGDIFKSLYCEDAYCTEENGWAWTEEDSYYGSLQNKESVYP